MTAHPILDRSPAVRANADAMGLSCPDTAYTGWRAKYRFVCAAGHERLMALNALASGVHRCGQCTADGFLHRLRDAVVATGNECLDTVWRGATASYRFRCARGHEWNHSIKGRRDVRQELHCPLCKSQAERLVRHAAKLAEIRETVSARGGTCLNQTYLGTDAQLHLRCAEGHEWQTPASNLFRGAWCHRCAQIERGRQSRLQDGLARLQQVAARHGGLLLSTVYEGSARRYAMRCAAGHEWEARGSFLLEGQWCRQCAATAHSLKLRLANGLQALYEAAQAKGGECLATVYEGAAHRYPLRCAKGHEWEATGAALRKGHWCTVCMHDGKRLSLEDARETARAKGGECLSQIYINTATHMSWLCHRGHQWSAVLNNIRSGKWCPQCAHMDLITNRKSKARRRHEVSIWHGVEKEPGARPP